ncbi:hypothetical protein OG585_02085 [Streptomyces sp. NBC_01340]|uniref:hypothetical protein n=1 Tax=unclassified Streptomyces TaxID=2593676 RepID=UPI00224FB091|nr:MULTISPECIES: hypothetical protein [unclassified Streptomyces]MCX4461941.1 hypothetical protein [Streptomyces sp. NBC_01719]MCX4490849.1 hypothetical protein [Streptomyces sp. NBC_01728]MCX4594569.1 hypothetical protein [Streptomyces sp. NBC_01549]WSI36191.1 hypothetical protein OG585_02085 [Streptomyces sp. NBC_01340]
METILKNLRHVPWRELQDSTGSATGIPLLLATITSGDEATAVAALVRLRQRICQYGFVVDQATAATVPFLCELAQLPQVPCRVQILQLLKNIADARQWENTAIAYPKLLNRRENYVEWEREARRAVRAHRGTIQGLLGEPDKELVQAAEELASALAD